MYICTCDNCECDYEEYDLYMVYPDQEEADNAVRNNGEWIREGDKYYCPDCFRYDENDNLIIDKSRKRQEE